MRGVLVASLVLATGCDRVFGLATVDAGVDSPDGAIGPDAQTCFGSHLVTFCLQAPPLDRFDVIPSTEDMIDTDSAACIAHSGPADLCVVAAGTFRIQGALHAIGSRPLVLVAISSLEISSTGLVDVSSTRTLAGAGAEPTDCLPFTTTATTSGGGAGGSFAGSGGNGGSANGAKASAIGTAGHLRGGCSGSRGGGGTNTGNALSGHGGGAVYLMAGASIAIAGTVDASGGGGAGGIGTNPAAGGAGGGGSGGMIGIEAPAVAITGFVFANGGGGGEGGGSTSAGNGAAGAEPTAPDVPAAGGANLSMNGGDGGDGAFLTTRNGKLGATPMALPIPSSYGAGGGGGGIGVILVYPVQTFGMNVSPPPG